MRSDLPGKPKGCLSRSFDIISVSQTQVMWRSCVFLYLVGGPPFWQIRLVMAWLKPHHPRLVGSVLPRADIRSAMTGLGQGQPPFGCFRFRASLFHGSRILSSTPTSLLQVARLAKANPARGSLYSSSLRRSTSLCRPAGPGNRFTPSRSAAVSF